MACPVFGMAGMRSGEGESVEERGRERDRGEGEERGGEGGMGEGRGGGGERSWERREKKKTESFVTKLLASHAGSPNPYHSKIKILEVGKGEQTE